RLLPAPLRPNSFPVPEDVVFHERTGPPGEAPPWQSSMRYAHLDLHPMTQTGPLPSCFRRAVDTKHATPARLWRQGGEGIGQFIDSCLTMTLRVSHVRSYTIQANRLMIGVLCVVCPSP